MRVSSNTLYDSNVSLLGQQQGRLMQTQQQITSGRRILTAADDPVAAARALQVTQSDATNTQYAANRTVVRHKLSLAESNLQGVTSLLQDVRTAVVSAGGGSFNSNDRKSVATELSGRLQELIGFANSTDGVGNYLFAGFQSKTQPFVATPTGIGYSGDDGQQNIQVSATRQIAAGDSGADVFMRVKNGNGTFVTRPAATNTGSGIISTGSVTNPAALVPGNSYSISFSLVAGVMNYTVTGAPVALAAPVTGVYVSGQAISFDGMQLDIQGAPAVTDTFTVSPSTNESIFKTLSDLIDALNAPVVGANMANSLNLGLKNLDNALNHVLDVRSSLGLRLNETDALQTAGDDLGLQYRQILSELQDVDYNKAISDLSQQQFTLQAAQKSFVKIAELSLFNYI